MKNLVWVYLIVSVALGGCMVKTKGNGGKVQVNPGHVKVQAK